MIAAVSPSGSTGTGACMGVDAAWQGMPVPIDYTVTRLSTTPIKGLMLHHPDSVEVTQHGVPGDRQFYLIDESGKLQSCTRNQSLYGLTAAWDQESRRLEVRRGDAVLISGVIELTPGGPTALSEHRTLEADNVADPSWNTFFSDVIGQRVQLLQARGSAFDVQPVTLLGSGSVTELARHSGLPSVDSARFRMLIEFSSDEPHIEDTWNGQLLEVGDAALRAGGPVKRCAATTRNPASGAVDLQTLRLITDYRGRQESALGTGANFGVYGTVLEPGTISVGDSLKVDTDS